MNEDIDNELEDEEDEREWTDDEIEATREMMFPNGPSDDEYEW